MNQTERALREATNALAKIATLSNAPLAGLSDAQGIAVEALVRLKWILECPDRIQEYLNSRPRYVPDQTERESEIERAG